MSTEDRRFPEEINREKQQIRHDFDASDMDDEDEPAQKRRRPWKEDHRRDDRQSKKQRQRNPEWND